MATLYWVVSQDTSRVLGLFPSEEKARLLAANTAGRCDILAIEAKKVEDD